ncbi:MAG TPA: M28 family peptidase, partial [Gemmatimonadaceae bacterium]|nr:M28 family peptidase [Gemmatimonadaceae bacterium]
SRCWKIARIITASVLSASAAQAQRQVPAAVQHYFDLIRPEFSGQKAFEQTAFMDQYFRWPGNTGFNASIQRVEGILKTAGYVEESAAKPGDALTYRIEHRPMRTPAWEPVGASVTIAGERDPVLSFATNRNMLAINSFSTPDTGVLASVVDVGKGSAADYDRIPVRGKIVLAEGNVGGVFGEAVQRRGAIGVFAYSMPAYTQPTTHTHSIQFGSIAYDSTKRSWGMPISRDALDRLRAAMTKGPVMVRVRTASKMYPSDELTLVAEVHGNTAPTERFVLSAHVQEPGANDNASGVGDLSEMARVLGTLVRNGSVRPKRTITMLFGLEITQTRNFLADDSVRTRGVRWGLSLDMTGEDTKKTGGTFLIEKMPDPSAIWTRGDDHHSEWGGSPVTKEQLVPHYYNDYLLARCLDQAATTGWVVRTNPFEGGSDHTPFLQFKKPGALFWHFTDVYYHTDGDRIDKVSVSELTNVGEAALAAVLTLTSADGPTARALVGEIERAALARLDAELALSRAALAASGDRAKETDILRTWTDYYVAALHTMTDIEVGGSSPQTRAAIDAAAERVKQGGDQRLALIAR